MLKPAKQACTNSNRLRHEQYALMILSREFQGPQSKIKRQNEATNSTLRRRIATSFEVQNALKRDFSAFKLSNLSVLPLTRPRSNPASGQMTQTQSEISLPRSRRLERTYAVSKPHSFPQQSCESHRIAILEVRAGRPIGQHDRLLPIPRRL
jgi:hypothetical protein